MYRIATYLQYFSSYFYLLYQFNLIPFMYLHFSLSSFVYILSSSLDLISRISSMYIGKHPLHLQIQYSLVVVTCSVRCVSYNILFRVSLSIDFNSGRTFHGFRCVKGWFGKFPFLSFVCILTPSNTFHTLKCIIRKMWLDGIFRDTLVISRQTVDI